VDFRKGFDGLCGIVDPPPPLDAEFVKKCLADLRGILASEVPVAAEAIRALTGPIRIRQEKPEGRKRGARWSATFTPDFLRLLQHLGRAKNYPEYTTLACRFDRPRSMGPAKDFPLAYN